MAFMLELVEDIFLIPSLAVVIFMGVQKWLNIKTTLSSGLQI